jgi:uncharacterized protein (TIGR00730 family)
MSPRKKKWSLKKAYQNLEFLNSDDARVVRILAEFLEPQVRFRKYGIEDTVVFFGSARARPVATVKRALARARRTGSRSVAKLERRLRLAQYYEDAAELARRLTAWSLKLDGGQRRFVICSGGGPGIMEAANRGARAAGGVSVGLNVSLPMEQAPNRYLPRRLSFEFHYFFLRKFWFVCPARALIVFPGGFGTFDELFEILTLLQTRKTPQIPVVIYGPEYWREIVDFDALVRWGTISRKDLDLIHWSDTPAEAFRYLKEKLQ